MYWFSSDYVKSHWFYLFIYSCGQKKRRTFWNFFCHNHIFVSFWDSDEKLISLERRDLGLCYDVFGFSYSHPFERYWCVSENCTLCSQSRLIHFDSSNIQKKNFETSTKFNIFTKKNFSNPFCYDYDLIVWNDVCVIFLCWKFEP